MNKQESPSQAYSLLEEKIKEILKVTKGKHCIFRGEDAHYDKISCTLYREKERVIKGIKYKPKDILSTLDIPAIEKKNIEKARRLFSDATSNVEILTQLQHYGGKTSLIDFTRNVHIALFFACLGRKEGERRVICLNIKDINPEKELYPDKNHEKPLLIEPSQHSGGTRVVAQHSVFVHCPHGFLEKDYIDTITIEKGETQDILEALKRYHNIHQGTVFNDIQGFIASSENNETTDMYVYIIEKCTKAIEQNPNDAEAHTTTEAMLKYHYTSMKKR